MQLGDHQIQWSDHFDTLSIDSANDRCYYGSEYPCGDLATHEKDIYFHLGLGKTGTTFLQYRAFPYFQGLDYIQRTKYHRAKDIIKRSSSDRYFLSFECDQQLEEVVKDWAADFPKTRPIICFRRHDSWIASQYRRFVKNGHVRSFQDMLDLEHDTGRFKQKDLYFRPMLDLLEQHFEYRPIVLFHDDLKADPKQFIHDLALAMDSDVDVEKLDLRSKHSSYSPRQLRFLLAFTAVIPLDKRVYFKNKTLEFIRRIFFEGFRYLILFIGRFWPDKGDGPLMQEADKKAVRDFYAKDWDAVLEYAQRASH